jgi:glycerol-3-phosphate acyltransferase PlsY
VKARHHLKVVFLTLEDDFCILKQDFPLNHCLFAPVVVNSLIVAGIVGYLTGSIPTAYLLVKWKTSIDIRNAGSGNVGTLNSFEVTKSTLVGVTVLVADLVKGAAAVLAGTALGKGEFMPVAAAAIMAILGHNFPVWLKFRGGRGLAPAAGVMLAVCWVSVAVWGTGWASGFALTRHVNVANMIATVLLLVVVWILPDALLQSVVQTPASAGAFRLFCTLLLVPIVIRHVEPVREYFGKKL